MSRRSNDFQTIRSEGGLLPPDLLRRVLDPKEKLPGTRPEDYGLPVGERLNEVITQSWNRLRKHWMEFQSSAANLPYGEPATGLTNEKWSLPLLRELGFGLLPTSAGPEVGGRTYAINRLFGPVPLHLVGCGLSLDRRAAGVRGAAAVNPHGLVQDFLNRGPGRLWGIVSNGLLLRVLRDSQALSRQSFLEFDVETMFAGEVYSDFVLLWLVAHATRFAPLEVDRPESCWLEEWTKLANKQGTRALGDLRTGVEKALKILGEGFTSHPKNVALRDGLRTGLIQLADFHGQLLRLVYRLIFLFVAEDRTIEGQSMLHPRDESETARLARERYAAHYSSGRLRELASRIKGSRHGDLWKQFQLLIGALSGSADFAAVREHLSLPVLGSFLWNPASTAAQNGAELTNHDFLEALRYLAFTRQGKVLRPVDYKNLGAEELGGVYESLLALTPQISADGARFTFAEFAGNERKTSGSYYTPDSLVQCLLDSALDPVVEEAIKGKNGEEAEKAILSLKICDPAVGSGHFLVGAAHRLARHLARARALAQGESEPSPLLYQHALRDVIGRCLYGVDVNPMAAELCRVSLWLEALEPGKPLSFLDHHIRVGNSLLGTTPELIAAGFPDAAFNHIEGDDRAACAELRKRNRAERNGWGPLFAEQDAQTQARLQQAAATLEELPDARPEDIRAKEMAFHIHERTGEYQQKKKLHDAWCAAFVIHKYFPPHLNDPRFKSPEPFGVTHAHIVGLASGNVLPGELEGEVERLSDQYQFFHWHLAFPEVFTNGGFDCVLGNPPWERLKLQEKEWFAERNPAIANAPNAAVRRRLIDKLRETDLTLYLVFQEALRRADGESCLIRDSARYPLCGRGDVNTYSIFAELKLNLLNPSGRVGCIVPSGIATDDTTKFFFQNLIDSHSLYSLYIFENEGKLFPGIDHRNKFALLTISGKDSESKEVDVVFGINAVEELAEKERHYTLTTDDIALLNPNTRTCPIFRDKNDAELTKFIYQRIPILIREARNGQREENPWGLNFMTMFHMANDSGLFHTQEQLGVNGFVLKGNIFSRDEDDYLPLYEGKMIWQFDHRFGTYEGQSEAQANQGKLPELTPEQHGDPGSLPLPRYWVAEAEVKTRIPKRPEPLASALDLPERWRNKAILRTFSYWAAGYWRKKGDEAKAANLLAVALRFSVTNTQVDIFNRWFLCKQCDHMQERFPLTEADVERMESSVSNPVPLAEELLERFSPHWFVTFRDITNAVVLRTAVFSILPFVGVGHTAPLVFFDHASPHNALLLIGFLNSFALDYCARQSVGGSHLTYSYLKQFPIPSVLGLRAAWDNERSLDEWHFARIIELVFTAWDHERFARDGGDTWPPFVWDGERRFLIRAELDAAFFHLYLGNEQEWQGTGSKELLTSFPTPRHAVEYIMNTFRVLRERDEAAHGHFKTREGILEIYDAMTEAIRTGQPYQTRLDPLPGPPMDADGNFIRMDQWDRREWPSHIHLPRQEPVEIPEEVPFEEFAAMRYPASDMDRAICVAALAIVEQSHVLSSADHFDCLLLATHPNWCKVFLNQDEYPAFEAAKNSTTNLLLEVGAQPIKWKECRDYLEEQHAITIQHGEKGQPISSGTKLILVRNDLPKGVDEIVGFALKAIKHVAALRKNLSTAPKEQVKYIRYFDEQHRVLQLVV